MSNPAAIFEIIDKLIAALPLAPPLVSAVLGVGLARAPEADTPALQAYTLVAEARGQAYADVDLRMPDADVGSGIVRLSVTLATDPGLDMAAVVAHYGQDFRSQAPSPRYKPGQVPIYVEYDKPWGTLSFSISDDGSSRLLGFGLATKP